LYQSTIQYDEGIPAIHNGDYKQAVNIFNSIIDDDKSNSDALFYLGYTYALLEQYHEARAVLEKALIIDSLAADLQQYLETCCNQKESDLHFVTHFPGGHSGTSPYCPGQAGKPWQGGHAEPPEQRQ
jgi:tetratricopeptide (TPR) repeat protein